MKTDLCISIRFIQPFPLFHGRRNAEQPEWPPSPMRAFQAIINAASLRARGRPLAPEVRQALQAMEVLQPLIIAPRATLSSVGYRAYVPHNQYDLVLAALHRGMEPSTEAFRKLNGSVRAEKDFRPMRIELVSDDIPTLHYLYAIDATTLDPDELLSAIRPSVRAITHLGWGIDQVVADATLIDRASVRLSGERWLPSAQTGRRLRVHRTGSLDALTKRYGQFVNRLKDGWTPVAPFAGDDFDQIRYRRDTDPVPRPYVVFKLLDENDDTIRYPHAKLIHIAGMVRHLAIKAMDAENGNPPPWIENAALWVSCVVRGKRDESAGDDHKQFSYVPLPSIGHAHADAMIRNIMIVAPLGMERELNYLAEHLDGLALEPEGDPENADSTPFLSRRVALQKFTPPRRKFISECYLGSSSAWETVTPVILDGINRRSKNDKPETIAMLTNKLVCKALARAGIEAPCEFTWQKIPFLKNCLSAHEYDRHGKPTGYFRPTYLEGRTAVHVRLRFGRREVDGDPNSRWIEAPPGVSGPLMIGAGRHCGFGLFAAANT
jgi:CRISPR-associated protein Csb2